MSCLKDRILLDGSSQLDRLPTALVDGYITIDDFDEENYYNYLRRIANEIIFYNLNHFQEGSWDFLFQQSFSDFLFAISKKPHLALLEVFVKIYIATVQQDLNKLPGKHLSYFYKNVLGFKSAVAKPDQVLLYFELNKTADQVLLHAGTPVTGVEPLTGSKVIYETDAEVVLNKAIVARYQSLFINKDTSGIYASPVANSVNGSGKALAPDNPYWLPFGESQIEKGQADRTMQDARIGFALSSNLLLLMEGSRKITITLTLSAILPFSKSRFRVWLSGGEGWHGPYVPVITFDSDTNSKMIFVINLPPSAPPVIPFSSTSSVKGFQTNDPLIFIEIDPSSRQAPYDILWNFNENNITVEACVVEVNVNGIKNSCIIENNSSVTPVKPFPLFGPLPTRGATFRIRCAEMAVKNITEISVFFDWLELPFNFFDYYKEYNILGGSDIRDTNYKLEIKSKLLHKWNTNRELSLFARTYIAGPVNFFKLIVNIGPSFVAEIPDFAPLHNDEIWEAELKVTGGPLLAFGHQEFSKVLSKQAANIAAANIPGAAIPNPPYTPTVKEFSLGYTAKEEMDSASLQFYQVQSFGIKKMTGTGFNLFPFFPGTGCLYIGLENLTPGQSLNLLFEFSENNSLSIDDAEEAFQLQWQYLANNEWKNLTAEQIVNDSTDNWRKPGIVSIQIPFDITADNTVAEAGIYWISACLLSNNTATRKLSFIRTQAVSATFDSSTPAQAGWNGTIPANTLQKLISANPVIKKVFQPLPSFNGYPAENDNTLFSRINERLRHKNRAIQYWDYERLVLNKFPEIFKVKCLFHTQKMNEKSPGAITLIIIPYVNQGLLQDRLEPQPSLSLVRKVKEFVSAHTSAWVEVNVAGPEYEQILLDFKVRFMPDYDPSFYYNKLEQDIYAFLAPWAFTEGKNIIFENRIHSSGIIYFIENLRYVNFITDFRMYHAYSGASLFGIGCMEMEDDFIIMDPPVPALGDMILENDLIVGFETNLAIATTSRSVLVSASHHRIEVSSSDTAGCSGVAGAGIGVMALERDFIIGIPC